MCADLGSAGEPTAEIQPRLPPRSTPRLPPRSPAEIQRADLPNLASRLTFLIWQVISFDKEVDLLKAWHMFLQARPKPYLGRISAVSRPYLGCISAVSRRISASYLGRISAVSRLNLGRISAESRPRISAESRPYLGRISAASRPHISAASRPYLATWGFRKLQESDCDVITGYNIVNFDLPYLLNRAAALNVRSLT